MKRLVAAFIALILLMVAFPATAGTWYLSDAAGTRGAPTDAAARSVHPWVLHVESTVQETIKALYRNGELVVEERLTPEGETVERYEYLNRNGRRVQTRTFTDEKLLHTDHLSYTGDGMLREIRRSYPDDSDGRERSSRYVFVRGRLHEELHDSGAYLDRIRYDLLGRIDASERLLDGELLSSTRYHYREDSDTLLRSVTEDRRAATMTTEEYDQSERSISEHVVRDGRTLRRVDRSYGPHGLVEEVGVEGSRRQVTTVRYDQDGNIALREQRLNDRLQSRIIYSNGESRVEERFRAGELILRLYFENGRQVAQEVVRDGEVVRSR